MKAERGKGRRGTSLSAKSVFSDPKQYLSFFFAIFIIQVLFLTLLIGAELNRSNAHRILSEKYDEHIILTGVSEGSFVSLSNYTSGYELWPELTFSRTSSGNVIGIKLDMDDPHESEELFWAVTSSKKHNINLKYSSKEYTPLYTDDPMMNRSGSTQQIILLAVFAVLAAVAGKIYHSFNHRKVRGYEDPEDRRYRSSLGEGARKAANRVLSALIIIGAVGALVCFLLLANQGNDPLYFWVYLILIAVCTAFLTVLFSMRVNHYKYRYGIFMTFGAGFSRLYRTGAAELLTVSLLTLLPAGATSALMLYLIYGARFIQVGVSFVVIGKFAVMELLIILIAVYMPIKRMAVSAPVTLLTAQDNSNLVSSPRRSFDASRIGFPRGYELRSMLRFRKYFVTLVLTAVAFTSIFLCGLYIARMVSDAQSNDIYEYTVTADSPANTLTEEDLANVMDDIAADSELASQIKYLYWNDEVTASAERAHMLVPDGSAIDSRYAYSIRGLGDDRYRYIDGGYSMTTDSFKFAAFDESLVSVIGENGIFTVEGDLSSVLDDPDTVVISESIRSLACFDFKVGDKIVIATAGEFVTLPDEYLLNTGNRRAVLRKMIEGSYFDYKEYTVGAVIDYAGNDDCIMVGMCADEYRRVTGKVALHPELRVYMDDSAYGTADFTVVRNKLTSLFSLYDYSVTETYNVIRSRITGDENHYGLITFMSVAVMLVSPMIWFFAQEHFFRRRKNELYILTSLGADRRRIRGIYLTEGIVLAVASAVMTLVLGFIADFLIYILCATFVPSLGSTGEVVFSFYMPPLALAICLLTALACGFLSAWIPYLMSKRASAEEK